jgi:simple sugar transport system permease protein
MASNSPSISTPQGFNLRRFLRQNGLQVGILSVMLLLWVIYVVFTPAFRQGNIYVALMSTVPYWGIVALPLTMLVIGREMDLSFPSIMAISVTSFVGVLQATGQPLLAFLACLLTGFVVGLINGLIVVYVGIPSLIATIGTQFFWSGMVQVITNGRSFTFTELRDTPFREILVGDLFGFLPMQVVWMILVGVAVWFLLNRHRFGAHVYLIGDNENTALLMGVPVRRTRVLMFAIVGIAAAFGGLLNAVEINNFFTNLGDGYLLIGLAAVFLGGTSVFGGVGTIFGTFIGAFIIASIQPAVVARGWSGFTTEVIYGLIIVLSVAMHTILRARIK